MPLIDTCVGKKILYIRVQDDRLIIEFQDSFSLELLDEAQYCCEERFLATDDDLSQFIGSTFLGVDVLPIEIKDQFGQVVEVQFLAVRTTVGTLTVEAHNAHNGNYSGFNLVARLSQREPLAPPKPPHMLNRALSQIHPDLLQWQFVRLPDRARGEIRLSAPAFTDPADCPADVTGRIRILERKPVLSYAIEIRRLGIREAGYCYLYDVAVDPFNRRVYWRRVRELRDPLLGYSPDD